MIMPEQERAELDRLKQRLDHLEQAVLSLKQDVLSAEQRLFLTKAEPQLPSIPTQTAPALETKAVTPAAPPPSPIEPAPRIPPVIGAMPEKEVPPLRPPEPAAPPPSLQSASPAVAPVPEERSFELRLGTYWMVRIGIVLLLTAMVFLGNYAYRNFFGKLGPAGKVSLLYVVSAGLMAAGAWWQRKAVKESLRNYGQVLFAGGLAAVYFTTYAAHHIPNLRVIPSPLLDGVLLLAWAGFMAWVADRRKSEVLALFAVGLAYYTSIITPVGYFTLYSNLVLTLAGVFFLVRNRWAGLTFVSVIASYAGYAYWRFMVHGPATWGSPSESLWNGAGFLLAYWTIFTVAVFLSKHASFAPPARAAFLTLNNVEFFALFVLTLLQSGQTGFWRFSLCYGVALLCLAEVARRFLSDEPLVKNLYLTQGLLLVTIGIIARYAGLQLAVLLAAESVVLFTLGLARKSLILQTAAFLCGALATGWCIDGLDRENWRGVISGAAVGGMLAFNAFWAHRKTPGPTPLIRATPAFFTVIALITWLATTWYQTSAENFPPALIIEALALTLSLHVLGLREMVVFGQAYAILACGVWMGRAADGEPGAWWNADLLVAVTVGLSHWWQRQKLLKEPRQLQAFWQGIYALATVGLLYFWLKPLVSPQGWLLLTSVLAIGLTAYGLWTRWWYVSVAAQLFLFVSAFEFVLLLFHARPAWYYAVAPIVGFAFLSFWAVQWLHRRTDLQPMVREPVRQSAVVYRWIALAMSLRWVNVYIPDREQVWVFAALGFIAFAAAGAWKKSEPLLFSAVFTMFGLGSFWSSWNNPGAVYLAQSARHPRIARAATDRCAAGGAVSPGPPGAARDDRAGRNQFVAAAQPLGPAILHRILFNSELVGSGLLPLRLRHSAARKNVSMGGPGHPGNRTGPRHACGYLEVERSLPDSQLRGARNCSSGSWLHLQQIPGEDQRVVVAIRRPD